MISPTPQEEEVLKTALKLFGSDSQFAMAYGECGEFIALSGRRVQGRATDAEFRSEIADVIIMMAQMRQLFGPSLVDAEIDFKMNRLKGKLQTYLEKK